MNKQQLNFVRDGVTKLPPGFRFQPTDEELVFQYLKCKVFSFPLPASIIPELNVCNYDPWDLPGELEQEKYFYSSQETKYRIGNRINRATASGYWKATGLDKQITSSSRRNQIAGMRKTLVFHMGKPPHGSRTDWIMHEYRLVTVADKDCNPIIKASLYILNYLNHQMEKWVICRIFLKKRRKKSEDDKMMIRSSCNNVKKPMANEPKFIDFMREKAESSNYSSSSSSSSSSGSCITEVCSIIAAEPDQESITSSNIVQADHERVEMQPRRRPGALSKGKLLKDEEKVVTKTMKLKLELEETEDDDDDDDDEYGLGSSGSPSLRLYLNDHDAGKDDNINEGSPSDTDVNDAEIVESRTLTEESVSKIKKRSSGRKTMNLLNVKSCYPSCGSRWLFH